jgi:hypothetical protein
MDNFRVPIRSEQGSEVKKAGRIMYKLLSSVTIGQHGYSSKRCVWVSVYVKDG